MRYSCILKSRWALQYSIKLIITLVFLGYSKLTKSSYAQTNETPILKCSAIENSNPKGPKCIVLPQENYCGDAYAPYASLGDIVNNKCTCQCIKKVKQPEYDDGYISVLASKVLDYLVIFGVLSIIPMGSYILFLFIAGRIFENKNMLEKAVSKFSPFIGGVIVLIFASTIMSIILKDLLSI